MRSPNESLEGTLAREDRARVDFDGHIQMCMRAGGDHAVREIVERTLKDRSRYPAFETALGPQDMWDAIQKLRKDFEVQKLTSVLSAARVDGIEGRLETIEQYLLSCGQGEPTSFSEATLDEVELAPTKSALVQMEQRLTDMKTEAILFQRSAIAEQEEMQQELLRLETELRSHVEAASLEGKLAATKGAVAQLEQRLADVETEARLNQRSALAEQDEMRRQIAEDFISIVTDGVRSVADLTTSTWVTKLRVSSVLDHDDPKQSRLGLEGNVSDRVAAEGSENRPNQVVVGSRIARANLFARGLQTEVVDMFATHPRYSQLEQGSSYALKLSMWDGSLYFGMRGFRKIDHVLFMLAFLANLAIQAVLCAIVFHLGQHSNHFPDSMLDSFARWRSLASEEDRRGVCEVDEATSTNFLQLSAKAAVDDYFGKMFGVLRSGPALVRAVIPLWFATLVNIFRDLSDLLTAVLKLTDWKSNGVTLTHGIKCCIFHSIPPKRCAWMMFVTLAQFIVVCILTIWGTMWLVNTTEISDLLLNAVALSFVGDADELVFQAFAPSIFQCMVSRTEPLPLQPPGKSRHLRSIASVCAVLSAVIVVQVTLINDVTERFERVSDVLCG